VECSYGSHFSGCLADPSCLHFPGALFLARVNGWGTKGITYLFVRRLAFNRLNNSYGYYRTLVVSEGIAKRTRDYACRRILFRRG
jgi:hypothetical protein